MTIDPRLADRRKVVAEDRARRNIRRLLRSITVVAALAAIVWLLLSPTFSVRAVEVSGVQSSRANEALISQKVVDGRPLVLIRAGKVESVLLEDPWVQDADVDIDWPDRVVVTIAERTPVAWVETASGWTRRAVDGVVLPGPDQPDDSLGSITLPELPEASAINSTLLLGSLEFLDNLPVAIGSRAHVEFREGELWGIVEGFEVRLGRPIEMTAKALTVTSLLAEDLEPGSIVNVIAPTNPAVSLPDRAKTQ